MSLVHVGFVHLRERLEVTLKAQHDHVVCGGKKIYVWDKAGLETKGLYVRVTFCGRVAPFGKLSHEHRVTCFGCMLAPWYTPTEWRELVQL